MPSCSLSWATQADRTSYNPDPQIIQVVGPHLIPDPIRSVAFSMDRLTHVSYPHYYVRDFLLRPIAIRPRIKHLKIPCSLI